MSRKVVIIVVSILIVLSITASLIGYVNKDKYNSDVIDNNKINSSNNNDNNTDNTKDKNETKDNKDLESDIEDNTKDNFYVCLDEEDNEYKIKLVINKEKCLNKSIDFKTKEKIKIINDDESALDKYYDGSVLAYTEEGLVKVFDAINNKYYTTSISEYDNYYFNEAYQNKNDIYGISLVKGNNYGDDEEEDSNKSYVYYSFVKSKLSDTYNYMSAINDKYLYLGNIIENKKSDNDSIDIKVLDLKTNNIIDISKEEYYGDSGLEEYDSSSPFSYFDVIQDKYYFFDSPTKENKIYDSNFKLLLSTLEEYILSKDNKIILKNKDNISVYDKDFNKIKSINKYENILNICDDGTILVNDLNEIKFLTFDDFINEKELINTGIKISENEKYHWSESKNNIITIGTIDYSKTKEDKIKLCGKEESYGLFGYDYTYNIKTNKLTKKNACGIENNLG